MWKNVDFVGNWVNWPRFFHILNALAPADGLLNTLAMHRLSQIIAAVWMLLFMSVPGYASERVTIFAAASLKGALDELAEISPVEMSVSYGGSGLIARQVAQGAPADLVILANTAWMDWLIARVDSNTPQPEALLGNTLVLIGPGSSDPMTLVSEEALLRRLEGGRLAVGLTNSVPAGIYARQWLESEGMWMTLRPHLAETDNVRAALALVARGEAPLGVVYGSDVHAEPKVRIVFEIPPETHDAITYPILVMDGKNASQASELKEFLMSGVALDVFLKNGFQPARSHP